jgi:hypothetical protein
VRACVWALRFLHNIFLPIISLLEKSPANLIITITLFSEIFFLNPKKSQNIFLCHIRFSGCVYLFTAPRLCFLGVCVSFWLRRCLIFHIIIQFFWFLIHFFLFFFFVFVMDDLFSYTGPPVGSLSLFFLLQIWKVIARLLYKLKIHDKKENNNTNLYPI